MCNFMAYSTPVLPWLKSWSMECIMCVCVCVCHCDDLHKTHTRQLSLKNSHTEFQEKPDKRFNRLQCHRRTIKRMWDPPKVFIFTSQRIPSKNSNEGRSSYQIVWKERFNYLFHPISNHLFLKLILYTHAKPWIWRHTLNNISGNVDRTLFT